VTVFQSGLKERQPAAPILGTVAELKLYYVAIAGRLA
jgi:hypothetical protein